MAPVLAEDWRLPRGEEKGARLGLERAAGLRPAESWLADYVLMQHLECSSRLIDLLFLVSRKVKGGRSRLSSYL
jgi:hypothetical protein